MENTNYIGFIGEGERKCIDYKTKKGFCHYVWYYFDWTNNEVYEYRRGSYGVNDEAVIATCANREGKRKQYDFHKIRIGKIEYPSMKGISFANTQFRKATIVEKMSAADSAKIIAMHKKQYGK